MLALNLLPGSGHVLRSRAFHLGLTTLIVSTRLCAQSLSCAGCSLNSALITAKQAQNTFGCVELKYFEHVRAADAVANIA